MVCGGDISTNTLDIRPVAASTSVPTGRAVPTIIDSHRYDTALIVWLSQIRQGDSRNVGAKAAGLGELHDLGIPVPPGFVLTTSLYREFLRSNRLDRLIVQAVTGLNPDDSRSVQAASETIQAAIRQAVIAPKIEAQILEAYQELRLQPGGALDVAVRPSIPPTEGANRQTMGHHTTLLGVSGNRRLLGAIKEVWASLFTPRAIYYRQVHGVDHQSAVPGAAIIIQALVAADVAGVLTTADATTGDQSLLTIEAAWGLGQAVVRGLLTPDEYVIEKSSGEVVERHIATQPWRLGRARLSGPVQHIPVPEALQQLSKLEAKQLAQLASLGITIERHFQFPQTTEWAIADGQVYFLESTPLPRVSKKLAVRTPTNIGAVVATAPRPLLHGTGATLGLASGPVRIIHSAEDLAHVAPGDVLVAELTTPDFLPAMGTIAAMVTDAGGRTSHAALLSHEFGIPVVVGTGTATHLLHEGQTVTVDGTAGNIYLGAIDNDQITSTKSQTISNHQYRNRRTPIRTGTKILVNMAIPAKAAEIAAQGADGVGLLRAEFMIAALGEHPKAMITDGRTAEYITKLADGIEEIARAFHPHRVVYRASDFKTNEYRALKGGEQYEPHEENPMLGLRGTARYLADPPLFQAELAALKDVRARRGYDNVQLMLPFVRTVPELTKAKEYVAAAGLLGERTFQLQMMVEVPSNVLLIDQFLDVGLGGVSIGSNDLTQLILGVDRDAEHLSQAFNELDPAVLAAIGHVIRACRARHVPVSVCGQAVSQYPSFTEFVVREGVTSLSVDPTSVNAVRSLVASIEHHLR